mmetsp:Transcript_5145/g.13222  ORF Transcript_5145/g.13222 Transcript_5145/m.13222 type:complete len:160 (-) Transcript_5145:74-553(-)
MAPERISGDDYSYAADVWAVGIVGLEGCLGVHPLGALRSYYDLLHELTTPESSIVPPHAEDGPLSANATDLFEQCLRKSPVERPTAEALLRHPLLSPLPEDTAGLARIVAEYIEEAGLDLDAHTEGRATDDNAQGTARPASSGRGTSNMTELERQLRGL